MYFEICIFFPTKKSFPKRYTLYKSHVKYFTLFVALKYCSVPTSIILLLNKVLKHSCFHRLTTAFKYIIMK